MAFKYTCRTYHYPLSLSAEQLLHSIDSFTGFKLFIPKDIHDTLDVFLDILGPIKYRVSRETLEKELDRLREELHRLSNIKSNNDNIGERIEDISSAIHDIEGILATHTGKDIIVENDILGYYQEKGRDQKPEISLNMKFLSKDDNLLAIVYVHELMHAYFDQQVMRHGIISSIEEPLAEYGMLCFMDGFTPVRYLSAIALGHVRRKKSRVGIKYYGFGAYLYSDKSVVYEKWLPEYKKRCVPAISHTNLGKYQDLFKGASYPLDEKSCKDLLYSIIFNLSSSKRGRLRVETGSKTIKLSSSADTFALAFEEAANMKGISAVMAANVDWCRCPLITTTSRYYAPLTSRGRHCEQRHKCNSGGVEFYVNTYSSDKQKKDLLEAFIYKLGLPWTVHID